MDKSQVIFRTKDGLIFFSFVVEKDSFDKCFLGCIKFILDHLSEVDFDACTNESKN